MLRIFTELGQLGGFASGLPCSSPWPQAYPNFGGLVPEALQPRRLLSQDEKLREFLHHFPLRVDFTHAVVLCKPSGSILRDVATLQRRLHYRPALASARTPAQLSSGFQRRPAPKLAGNSLSASMHTKMLRLRMYHPTSNAIKSVPSLAQGALMTRACAASKRCAQK